MRRRLAARSSLPAPVPFSLARALVLPGPKTGLDVEAELVEEVSVGVPTLTLPASAARGRRAGVCAAVGLPLLAWLLGEAMWLVLVRGTGDLSFVADEE